MCQDFGPYSGWLIGVRVPGHRLCMPRVTWTFPILYFACEPALTHVQLVPECWGADSCVNSNGATTERMVCVGVWPDVCAHARSSCSAPA